MERYKLTIIWQGQDKDEFYYNNYDEAKEIENGYKMAFGSQIEWSGITRDNGKFEC